jgi:hypothetical protein
VTLSLPNPEDRMTRIKWQMPPLHNASLGWHKTFRQAWIPERFVEVTLRDACCERAELYS